MITLRPSHERGHADHGWLRTHHSFSFADYHDPRHMGFHNLRVINEDIIAPGTGFGMHPHRDMEIITYVVSGTLTHRDSMGNKGDISNGQIQTMSAGTGIYHSETNDSPDIPVHLLQIWILPQRRGIQPAYAEWAPPAAEHRIPVTLLASADGSNGSARLAADAAISFVHLLAGENITYATRPAQGQWIQVISGDLTVNGLSLHAGDGAAVENERALDLKASTETRALLFDLA